MSRKTSIRSLLSQDVTPPLFTLTVRNNERRNDNEWTRLEGVFLIICFFPSAPSCTLSYLRQYYNSGKGWPAFCFITEMSLISKGSYNIPLICLFEFLWSFHSSFSFRLCFLLIQSNVNKVSYVNKGSTFNVLITLMKAFYYQQFS